MSKTLLERATASGPRLYLTQFALGTGRGTGLQITLGAEYVSIASPREANEIAQTILKWVHEETEARSRAGIPLDLARSMDQSHASPRQERLKYFSNRAAEVHALPEDTEAQEALKYNRALNLIETLAGEYARDV